MNSYVVRTLSPAPVRGRQSPLARIPPLFRPTYHIDYLGDSYSLLLHYKRAFKFLKGIQQLENSSALVLGNKHQITLDWTSVVGTLCKSRSASPPSSRGKENGRHLCDSRTAPRARQGTHGDGIPVDAGLIAQASRHYDFVLCLDPVLYARSLNHFTLPVVGVASVEDTTRYPEILDIIDYLIPATNKRADIALRDMVWNQLITQQRGSESPQR